MEKNKKRYKEDWWVWRLSERGGVFGWVIFYILFLIFGIFIGIGMGVIIS